LSNNNISDLKQLSYLAHLPLLTTLFLNDNPVYETTKSYRLNTTFMLQRLNVIDGILVSCEEKVAAINLFDPPASVIASVQNAEMVKKQAKFYAKIKAVDLLRATYLRPIVLCGPNGVGKRTLTSRLLKEYSHIYGASISHTTRLPRPGEEDGIVSDYID
jgi:hypothetical protein